MSLGLVLPTFLIFVNLARPFLLKTSPKVEKLCDVKNGPVGEMLPKEDAGGGDINVPVELKVIKQRASLFT